MRWNFPLMIGMWKVMPALAAGCSIVIKPSETMPLTTLRVAGWPARLVSLMAFLMSSPGQVLMRRGPDVTSTRCEISFTGSTATGKGIARTAADHERVNAGTGRWKPAIVLKDADPQWVIEGLMTRSFLNQGQVCAASSRIILKCRRLTCWLVDLSRR
ncbi:aldehyde dehydrogenase family protein [Escherichia coli]